MATASLPLLSGLSSSASSFDAVDPPTSGGDPVRASVEHIPDENAASLHSAAPHNCSTLAATPGSHPKFKPKCPMKCTLKDRAPRPLRRLQAHGTPLGSLLSVAPQVLHSKSLQNGGEEKYTTDSIGSIPEEDQSRCGISVGSPHESCFSTGSASSMNPSSAASSGSEEDSGFLASAIDPQSRRNSFESDKSSHELSKREEDLMALVVLRKQGAKRILTDLLGTQLQTLLEVAFWAWRSVWEASQRELDLMTLVIQRKQGAKRILTDLLGTQLQTLLEVAFWAWRSVCEASQLELAMSAAATRAAAATKGLEDMSAFVTQRRKGATRIVADLLDGQLERLIENAFLAWGSKCMLKRSLESEASTSHTKTVAFSVRRMTAFGEEVRIVGNVAKLGEWDPREAVAMQWTEGHVWVATVDLEFSPAASDNLLEYKYVLMSGGQIKAWESCENRLLSKPSSDTLFVCHNIWNAVDCVGKTGDELLPKLKERPLTLELDRSTHAESKHPHVEVSVKFQNVPGDLGMVISWGDSLPVVSAVREGSAAWNEGVFVGDAIRSVNDLSATAARQSILTALQQRPLILILWRRPIGADIMAPWKMHLHEQSPTDTDLFPKAKAKGKGKGRPPSTPAPKAKAPPITKAKAQSAASNAFSTIWQKADGDWVVWEPSDAQELRSLFQSSPRGPRMSSSALGNFTYKEVLPNDMAWKVGILINAKGEKKLPPAGDLMEALQNHSFPAGCSEGAELLERLSQLQSSIKQIPEDFIRQLEKVDPSNLHHYRHLEQYIFRLLPIARFSELVDTLNFRHLVESGNEPMQQLEAVACAFEQLCEATAAGQRRNGALRQVLLIFQEALPLVGGKWTNQQFTWQCLAEADSIKEPVRSSKSLTNRKKLLEWLASKHLDLFKELIQVLPALEATLRPLDIIQEDVRKIAEGLGRMNETSPTDAEKRGSASTLCLGKSSKSINTSSAHAGMASVSSSLSPPHPSKSSESGSSLNDEEERTAKLEKLRRDGKTLVEKLEDKQKRTLDFGKQLLQRLGEKPEELQNSQLYIRLGVCLRVFGGFFEKVKVTVQTLEEQQRWLNTHSDPPGWKARNKVIAKTARQAKNQEEQQELPAAEGANIRTTAFRMRSLDSLRRMYSDNDSMHPGSNPSPPGPAMMFEQRGQNSVTKASPLAQKSDAVQSRKQMLVPSPQGLRVELPTDCIPVPKGKETHSIEGLLAPTLYSKGNCRQGGSTGASGSDSKEDVQQLVSRFNSLSADLQAAKQTSHASPNADENHSNSDLPYENHSWQRCAMQEVSVADELKGQVGMPHEIDAQSHLGSNLESTGIQPRLCLESRNDQPGVALKSGMTQREVILEVAWSQPGVNSQSGCDHPRSAQNTNFAPQADDKYSTHTLDAPSRLEGNCRQDSSADVRSCTAQVILSQPGGTLESGKSQPRIRFPKVPTPLCPKVPPSPSLPDIPQRLPKSFPRFPRFPEVPACSRSEDRTSFLSLSPPTCLPYPPSSPAFLPSLPPPPPPVPPPLVHGASELLSESFSMMPLSDNTVTTKKEHWASDQFSESCSSTGEISYRPLPTDRSTTAPLSSERIDRDFGTQQRLAYKSVWSTDFVKVPLNTRQSPKVHIPRLNLPLGKSEAADHNEHGALQQELPAAENLNAGPMVFMMNSPGSDLDSSDTSPYLSSEPSPPGQVMFERSSQDSDIKAKQIYFT